ncbi:RNA cytidine acetyltransferase 1 isoform X2 [Jatropha curcas]|uniref:RNA cytidine acetyltransferase 1 isoform X1 n=1 Tax=Jatropha curcas TaxID=180498 RepID=UPI0005FAAADB|nr:RNA cytidine acetyltransferase 1 isoform X1 [Jatropha curcas]XP_037495466.1 RNA cytidine acetyltransferase 1 isoform X1 [Jatropha curcas]XP_037495467.1 RNA cytidine acetyltransferase 1 isoform X2 [Jatropha curcas]
MRKKVDDRIRTLIENGVKARHRSMFVIIGDKSRDQIVNLHYMLSKAVIKARPNVLWCYKEKLELSSHKKKRAKQVKQLMQRGLLDAEKADPFSLFVESGVVSYCLYRDSERILGNTYGMCILQDFEALTPNILARTIETVEGGGLVVLLIRSLSSLTSLCTMVMDIHERFRTESHSEIVSRFNERFLLSLASCKACLVMDDELNILPISSHAKSAIRSSDSEGYGSMGMQEESRILKEQLHGVLPIGPLLGICTTFDQGKAISTLVDAILDKAIQRTITLTASRGRGKSAALGLAIAGAVAAGYSRIFVTAPSPENLISLFEFVCRGLHALNYEEHLHYDLERSTNPEYRKAIRKVYIYREHKQVVQYIQPQDHLKLSQAELLVIDEAAAIPLPVVKSLLGQYLVFISSTVNGYEGTGRSLSLKLFSHLEKQSQNLACGASSSHSGNLFHKIELKEPIRYASEDPIESWLNGLLCLDTTNLVPPISRFPHPTECNLYYVNRDTLFSFHKESEMFLQRMVALYVSSHYKNSPNDLQLMADAPAHHLFVLLGPVDETRNILPDILCVIQVCLEGEISRKSASQSLQVGRLPSGDQIPWKFCEEFENTDFPNLSGVRIVRIAVHPSVLGHGYGSVALDLLTRYYEGKLTAIDETNVENNGRRLHENIIQAANQASLLEETIAPRENLPPLLTHPRERLPERVNYIGVSFGLNKDLFRFWKKHKFTPFYICDNPNNRTGEHSCMMLKPLETDDIELDGLCSLDFLAPFYQCFKRKFVKRLPLCFRELDYKLAMSILDPKIDFSENETSLCSEKEASIVVKLICSPDDVKLLDSYANNRKDYGKVMHLLPLFAYYYFDEKLPIQLSHLQASLLLCMGLQLQSLTDIQKQMKIERTQVLHLFRKVMMKFYKYFYGVLTNEMDMRLPRESKVEFQPHSVSVDEDLNDGAKQVMEKMRIKNMDLLKPELLQQYCINDKEAEFEQALKKCSTISPSGVISVKANRKASEKCRRPERTRKGRKRKMM